MKKIRVKVKADIPEGLLREVGYEAARAVGFGPTVEDITLHGPHGSVEIRLSGHLDEVLAEVRDLAIRGQLRIRSLVELCQAADQLGTSPESLAETAMALGVPWRALVRDLDQGLLVL